MTFAHIDKACRSSVKASYVKYGRVEEANTASEIMHIMSSIERTNAELGNFSKYEVLFSRLYAQYRDILGPLLAKDITWYIEFEPIKYSNDSIHTQNTTYFFYERILLALTSLTNRALST